MKSLLVFTTILILSSVGLAAKYDCKVLRNPGLKCGGYNYGNVVHKMEIDTQFMSVNSPIGGYAGILVSMPEDINTPCDYVGKNKDVPVYIYEVNKTSDNKLELIVMSLSVKDGAHTIRARVSSSEKIGTPVIRLSTLQEPLNRSLSTGFECRLQSRR